MHFDWRSFIDWVSVVSSAGTVIAAGLALYAILQSGRQAHENAELIVAERRRDVQLEALQRLSDAIATPAYNQPQQWQRRQSAQVELAIIEADLPLCRARFSRMPHAEMLQALNLPADTPPDAIDGANDPGGSWTVDRMVDEIAAAVRDQVGRPHDATATSASNGPQCACSN